MFKTSNPLFQSQHGVLQITLIVGENGAGKSRALRDLAVRYRDLARPVFTICNTTYDRLSSIRGVAKISAAHGRQLPMTVIKRAITSALSNGLTKLGSISKTLDYCGYEPQFGLSVSKFSPSNSSNLEDSSLGLQLTENDIRDIQSAVAQASRRIYAETVWMDFSGQDFEAWFSEGLARIVKWESVLRKAKVLSGIDIYLKRRGGQRILLGEASSGELTLISTLIFLAVNVTEDAVLLIDEPENSLHPQWQKEYVERLANLLHYQHPTVFIATHAPIVVSGALTSSLSSVRMFQAENGSIEQINDAARSVEGTLWQLFRTVTPLNHYLSERLVGAITDMENGSMSATDVFELINAMESAAYDPAQQSFFRGVRKLAEGVASDLEHG